MKRWSLFCALLTVAAWAISAQASSLNLITYNVENLFDWTHDPGKKDFTYLPLAVKRESAEVQAFCAAEPQQYQAECFGLDWSEANVRIKLRQLARVLREAFADGLDVAVLQEVENLHAVGLLAHELGPNYTAHLIEGPDERGIDVAMITRLPVLHLELREFAIPSGRRTRGILRMDVQKANKRITILGNHWPSQGNPDEDRMAAADTLVATAQAAHESDLVIAAGDFNTAEDDVRNGIKERLLPIFFDAEMEARASGLNLWPGTYNFRGVWGSLDHIFVLKSHAPRRLNWNTVKIRNEGLLETRVWNGVPELHPQRFNVVTGEGFSDHLPLSMSIEL